MLTMMNCTFADVADLLLWQSPPLAWLFGRRIIHKMETQLLQNMMFETMHKFKYFQAAGNKNKKTYQKRYQKANRTTPWDF